MQDRSGRSSQFVRGQPLRRNWILLCLGVTVGYGAERKRRTLQGKVTDLYGSAIQRALVQLKHLTTLKIRSCVTDRQGRYRFVDLNFGQSYEVHAFFGSALSETERISEFDSRSAVIVNLEIERWANPMKGALEFARGPSESFGSMAV